MRAPLPFFIVVLFHICSLAFSQYAIQYVDDSAKVEILQEGSFLTEALEGTPLFELDTITTQESQVEFATTNGNSALVLDDNASITLAEFSDIEQMTYSPAITLTKGKIRTIVASDETPLEMSLGTASIYSDSGEFIAWYMDDGSIEITAYYGTIIITDEIFGIDQIIPNMSSIVIRNGIVETLEEEPITLARKMIEIPFRTLEISNIPGYQETFSPEYLAEIEKGAEVELVRVSEGTIIYDPEEWMPTVDPALFFESTIGSLTVGEYSYGIAALKPSINLERLRLKLHLGVGVRAGTDATDFQNWYRSRGNFEWDFGTSYFATDLLTGVFDLLTDLSLKIEYLEIFSRQDPIFFRIGLIENIREAMGTFYGGFTNAPNFPIAKQSGLFLDVNLDYTGFKFFTESFSNESLYGGRFYFRPGGRSIASAELGLNFLADLGLSKVVRSIPDGTPEELTDTTNPLRAYQIAKSLNLGYLAAGVDIRLPVVFPTTSEFNLVIDGNVVLPFTNNELGFVVSNNSVWEPSSESFPGISLLAGFAGTSDLTGEVIFNYLFTAQYLGSLMRPQLLVNEYDRNRLFLINKLVAITDTDATGAFTDEEALATIRDYSIGARFEAGVKTRPGFSALFTYFLPAKVKPNEITFEGLHEMYLNISLESPDFFFKFSVYANLYDVLGTLSGVTPFISEYTDLGATFAIQPYEYLSFETRIALSMLEDLEGLYMANLEENRISNGGSLLLLINIRL